MTQRKTSFSAYHTFPRDEVQQLANTLRAERPWTRWVLNVTTGHREVALRQFLAQAIIFGLTVIGIAVAEYSSQILDVKTRGVWLLVAIAVLLVRVLLFAWIITRRPSEMARSMSLRLVPLCIVAIAATFWIWTIQRFVGPVLTVRELFLVIALLGVTIAMVGMWSVSKAMVGLYVGSLWVWLSVSLHRSGAADWPVLLCLNVSVLALVWLYVWVSIHQVKRQLERSDEMDLLAADLMAANDALAAMKDAAHSALQTRSQFFAEASHDFRQRLYATKLMVVSARSAAEKNGDVIGALNHLSHVVDSLEKYMSDVLDFARLEAQDVGVQLRPMGISELFQKLELHFEGIAASKGVALLFRRGTRAPVLQTDPALLQRMVGNLISNAIEHTRGAVCVCARWRGARLSIEIWDQGPGIPAAEQGRVFEAFYRSATVRARPSSLGLGLAIVRRFSDRLGYEVELKSRVNRGSVFRILVPATAVLQPHEVSAMGRGAASGT